jgi:hypothetical protein
MSSLRGSLLKDMRRLLEAELAFAQASVGFGLAQDMKSSAGVELARAALLKHQGDLSGAIEVTKGVLPTLAAAGSDRQILWAHHNLAVYLCESGQPEAAQRILSVISPLYDHYPDRVTRIRRRWLRGLIALETGDPAAESLLQGVIRDFLDTGRVVIAAVAALDLARLYLADRRVDELDAVVASLVRIFSRAGIHREAAACVTILARSVAERAVSGQMIAELRQRLERVA